MENNTNQLNSMMCKKNCGFFGNAACDGYCSKCYKDHVKRQNSGSANGRVTPTTGLTSSSSSVLSNNIQSQSISPNESSSNQLASIGEQTSLTCSSSSSTSNENKTSSEASAASGFAVPSSLSSSNNTSSSSSNNNNNNNTPVLSTQLSSSSSIPIPIPSKSQSINNNAAASSAIDMGMSVPSDLLATSPMNAACSVDESGSSMGTSIGSEKKKRSRCVLESCKRKVGLTGFDCRCGGLYCWEHRYSDKHNCKFDYKELGQDQIRKNNPIVVGEKIQKI